MSEKQRVLDGLEWMAKTYKALAGEDNDHSILRAVLQETIAYISERPSDCGSEAHNHYQPQIDEGTREINRLRDLLRSAQLTIGKALHASIDERDLDHAHRMIEAALSEPLAGVTDFKDAREGKR